MDDPGRSLYPAFLATGASALPIWMAVFFVHTLVLDGPTRAAQVAPYVLLGGILFGLPLVAVVLLVAALPAVLLLRRAVGLTLPRVLAVGGLCGLLARWSVALLWAEPETSFLPVPVALLVGVGTAAVGWRAWRGPSGHEGWKTGGVV